MKGYLIGLTAAAILASLIRKVAPDNSAGKAAQLGAGLLILVTLLAPLGQLDLMGAADALVKHGWSDPLSTTGTDQAANELLNGLITSEAESYILDKAQALGLALTVEVTTQITDRYPVPWSVRLQGTVTEDQKRTLSQYIAETLNIPEERQEWSDM